MGSVSTREQSIARMADVMRDFMANAVLFQDAVARTGGLNSTDLQAVSLLMSQGPATPGELAERTGLTAGGAITAVDRPAREGRLRQPPARPDRPAARHRHRRRRQVLEQVGPIYGRVGAALGRLPGHPHRRADRVGERALHARQPTSTARRSSCSRRTDDRGHRARRPDPARLRRPRRRSRPHRRLAPRHPQRRHPARAAPARERRATHPLGLLRPPRLRRLDPAPRPRRRLRGRRRRGDRRRAGPRPVRGARPLRRRTARAGLRRAAAATASSPPSAGRASRRTPRTASTGSRASTPPAPPSCAPPSRAARRSSRC